jgi:hypothetical protein
MTFDIEYGGLHTVISGGQTGADQGGLYAAGEAGLKTGGQASAEYMTSKGKMPELAEYGLVAAGDYAARTRANVKNSDGTVVIGHNLRSAGSRLTSEICEELQKPCIRLSTDVIEDIAAQGPSLRNSDLVAKECERLGKAISLWVIDHQIQVLNIAGNREFPSGKRMEMTTNMICLYAFRYLQEADKLIIEF